MATEKLDVEAKVSYSHNFNENKICGIPTESKVPEENEKITFEKDFMDVYLYSSIIAVLLLAAGILFQELCGVSGDISTIVFFIITAVISIVSFVISFVLVSRVKIKTLKMDFLKDLINSTHSDKELIKKYCDTLTEI